MTTNNDLNVGLARLMGWVRCASQAHDELRKSGYEPGCWVRPGRGPDSGSPLPPRHRSLDALFAPGGPVEYARNKGWGIQVEVGPAVAVGSVYSRSGTISSHYADDPAEALATALHEAFGKEQGQ